MKNYYTTKGTIWLLMLSIVLFSGHSLAQTYAPLPYYTGFESGSLGTEWTATSSQAGTNIEVIQTGTLTWGGNTAASYAGNYYLGMDHGNGGSYNLNQADLHLNTTGVSNYRIEFEWAEWNDETEVEDGVYISDDGGATFVKVLDLPGAAYPDLTYTHFDMSLDSINSVHGLSFTAQYVIRFQQYDNFYFAGGNDGHMYDEINIYETCATSSSITASTCDSYTVPSGNQTYTSTGIYFDTLVNSVLCDSIITIDLTVNSVPITPLSESACASYTATWGATYSATGVYYDTVPSVLGCDSITMLDLTIFNPSTASYTEQACDSFTSVWGTTYTSSGMYYDTTTNVSGCDSISSLDLTITTTTTATITESVLDSYTAPSGAVYTTSGQYLDTISNAAGCDSIITINLTVQYTGLDELTSEAISGYPNPVSDQFFVAGIDNWDRVKAVYVLDMQGRKILEPNEFGTQGVNVSSLPPGNYILELRYEHGSMKLQFVKN